MSTWLLQAWMMTRPYTHLALPCISNEEQVCHTPSMISATLLPISFSSIACLIISADPSSCLLILLSTILNLLFNHWLVEILEITALFLKVYCTTANRSDAEREGELVVDSDEFHCDDHS